MPDPELSPQDEQLRRLLADARHDEPTPDDVVDRLDRVLADLRPPVPASGVPDPGTARRRRTRRNLVLAAAVVVVAGVGVSRLDLSGTAGDSDGADSSADGSVSGQDAGGDALSAAPEDAPQSLQDKVHPKRGPLRLDSGSLPEELREYAARRGALSYVSGNAAKAWPLEDGYAVSVTGCADPAWGKGRRVPARYDGKRAVLVLRPARDGERVIDVYLCGADVPRRSTSVPVD